MSLNLASIMGQSARRDPGHDALLAGDQRIGYGDLDALCRRFAAGLAKAGLKPGQHLALMLPNTPQFTIAYFGSLRLGCPVVPLNILFTPDEIAYHLSDSDAVALVAWDSVLPQARRGVERAEACRLLVTAGGATAEPSAGETRFEELLAGPDDRNEPVATMPDDTAGILYTSGTTGRPKGAELTHFNLFYNAEVCGRLLPLSPETVALCALPLFHSFGQTVIQNAVLKAGGSIVLMPRFEPKAALDLMQRYGVTYFAGVPTMYFALLRHEEADRYDLGRLRHCQSGGAPMPVEVMRAFDGKYGVNILEGYGLSETSPVASFNVLDRPKKLGSIGLPIEGVEFRLVDDSGRIVEEVEAPGEICIKGHNVMKGYYNRPEATREAIQDGWFRTGDIARRDEDGYYFIVDRKKDMILRGGFNVYPREVEELLYAHPAVAEAAVVGVPDESLGEEVKAFIALKPGAAATAAEIVAYAKEHLAAYKYPRTVEFRESLPKGPTGKILKRDLKGRVEAKSPRRPEGDGGP